MITHTNYDMANEKNSLFHKLDALSVILCRHISATKHCHAIEPGFMGKHDAC